jgi:hypothetical protein
MSLYDLGSVDPTRTIFNSREYYRKTFEGRPPLEHIQRPLGDVAVTDTVIDLTEESDSDVEIESITSA